MTSITSVNISLHLTSDLKSATWITLVSMCILPQTDICVASEAMAASKPPRRSYDLRFEISNMCILPLTDMVASEAMAAYKQNWR